jgi:uncharacterized protein (TIGR02145 family)
MRLTKYIVALGCAALLGACSSTVSSDNDDFSPQTFSELGKCNNSNKGEMVYLPVDDERYLCDNGEWKQLSIVEKTSSSSKKDYKKENLSSNSKKDVPTSSSSISQEVKCDTGYLCDSRDDKKYKVTVIGDQTWMAENLNYEVDNSYCYDLANAYCEKYGRLYEWKAAMAIANEDEIITEPHQGICPTGWHIPTYDDFFTLHEFIDQNNGDEMVNRSLISKDWISSVEDKFGFSALGAGIHSTIGFDYKDENGYFWSSRIDQSNHNYNYWIIPSSELTDFESRWESLGRAYSVRCIKD